MSDITFALRQLAKSPGFTAVALLTLGVGIGSATVVFATLNAFLFKPIPHLAFPEDQLVVVGRTQASRQSQDRGLSYPDVQELRTRATTLAGVWAQAERTVIIAGNEIPERQMGTYVSWDAFDLLGVQPVLGRNFTAADAAEFAPAVALISSQLWRTRFGQVENVIGTRVTLNGEPTTIIGVMPDRWRYPDVSDVWTPLRPDPEKTLSRDSLMFHTRARLKDGVDRARAQAEIDAIMADIAARHPETHAGIGARLSPIREEGFQQTRQQTMLLFGAVLFVFLIACLNVTNLLLVRGVSRAKEMAIRLALGAPRARLVRQLITENMILGVLGGVGGVLLGLWGVDLMVAAIPAQLPFWLDFTFDARVLGFGLVLSVLGALLFGIVPALRASQPDLPTALKECCRTSSGSGPRANRLRNLLVIVQVALALVLLVGAGLMIRSFLELRRQDPGFVPERVLTFRTGLPPAMFNGNLELPLRFFADVLPRFRALPGVEAVGAISLLPGMDGDISPYRFEGEPSAVGEDEQQLARHRVATSGYFETVRIPLRAGRFFDDVRDVPGAPLVAIVDETIAVRHFGSAGAALGQRIVNRNAGKPVAHGSGQAIAEPPFLEIVGVVGAIRHRLDRPNPEPTVYVAHSQYRTNFLSVVIRTREDPMWLLHRNAVRDAVLAVNRDIPIYNPLTLEEVLMSSETVWPRRFFGWLFAMFGLIALFLACIGIYGVMSYNVTQRVREIGIRLALGAPPPAVLGLIVRFGLRLVGWGLGLGLVAALVLSNLLVGVLYRVVPHDPVTFVVVPLLLAAVALLACWLPGRRAVRIDPNAALRSE